MKRLALLAVLLVPAASQATITYNAVGVVQNSAASQTITVACPASPAANDMQVVIVSFKGGPTVPTPGGGAIPGSGFAALESNLNSMKAFGRTIVSGNETNPTIVTGASTALGVYCFSLTPGAGRTLSVDTSTTTTNSSATALQYPAITPGGNNEFVLWFGKLGSGATSLSTLAGMTEIVDAQANNFGIGADYVIQTTAATINSGSVTITGGSVATNFSTMLAIAESTTAPTYSAGPAIGTRTTSSIATTATTTCMDCTDFAILQTAGAAAPTCAQVKAAQDSSGAAAFKSVTGAMTANVPFTGTFTGISTGTAHDLYACMNSTVNNDSAVSTVANVFKLPAFTSVPAFSSAGTGGATYSLTLDGAGSVFGVACIKGATAPTVTQVEAGQCTGSVAAPASTNKSVSGVDSLIVGTILPLPIYSFYIAGSYGSQHETSVHADLARLLTAVAGKQYVTLASIDPSSACADLNAVPISPLIAVGDILKIDTATRPSSFTINPDKTGVAAVDTACNIQYFGDASRQKLLYDIYDDSAGGFMSGGPGTFWFNNIPPVARFPGTVNIYVPLNAPMTPQDESGVCNSPEGDTVTVSAVTTLPSGLSFSGNTLQGTGTVRGIYKGQVWRCTDLTGDSTDWQ